MKELPLSTNEKSEAIADRQRISERMAASKKKSGLTRTINKLF